MLKKLNILLLLTFIMISCEIISENYYYNQAFKLEEKGKYKEAIIFHNKAIKKNSKFRPSLLNRGADKSALSNFKDAIDDYKKILKFDPDNSLAMMNIGNNYENLNDFSSAITYYSMALNSSQIIKTDEFQVQIKYLNDFDKDYQYQVYDYELLFERGTAYLLNNQYKNAIIDLKKLIKTEQMIGDAYYYIGESYLGMKDTTNACKNYKVSVEKGISNGKEKIETLCSKE